jgi:hypothetical protein
VINSRFTLLLLPWSWRNNAQEVEVHILAELEICGILAHAWEQRIAETLLAGCSLVESVDSSTMSRYDMSCFEVTAWTHNIYAIPAVRWLAVPESKGWL